MAIKLLKSTLPGTAQCGRLCALLVREAQTLARISHPNVTGVYDVGDLRGCVYLAMEFIDGDTLSSWSARSGPDLERTTLRPPRRRSRTRGCPRRRDHPS